MKPDKPLFGFMTRNYLVLTFTSSLWGFAASITNTYFSPYVLALDGTETVIGVVSALGSVSFVIVAIIGGHIADFYGRKKLLGTMTAALGASQLLVAAAPNWHFLALAVIVVNVCWIMEPAFWAMLADSISAERRGVAFSMFSCINFLPWAVMPFIGGYLIDSYGVLVTMRTTYVALAFLGVISGVVRLSMLKETVTPKKETKKVSLKNLGELAKESFKEHFDTWLSMPHATLALAISYILWSFEYGLVEPYWIVYAEGIIGLTSTEWGAVTVTGSIIGLVMKMLIVGKILDKLGRRKPLLAVIALDAFTYLMFIHCVNFTQVIIVLAVSSVIWSFYQATYSSLEADLVPKQRRGRVYAVFSVAWSAFSIPASLAGGVIYQQINPQLSFILASIVVMLCFVTTAKFIHTPNKTTKNSNPPRS
ncbi:MAG: MFS transporter [Thermoproteota archaeon]|nr:MFS transporter [Thermoproteota archaeon]